MSPDNVAIRRTGERRQYDEPREMTPAELEKQRKEAIADQYIALHKQSEALAAQKRAEKIRNGTLVIHADGSYTERIS